MSKPSRKQALRIAQRLGCYGAHQADDGSWMPCESHDVFVQVSKGKQPSNKKSANMSVIERRKLAISSKSSQLFPTRDEAIAQSKINGCSGIRTVVINGGKMYAACMPKNNGRPENTGMISTVPKQSWQNLIESPVESIETLPTGGLVSGKEFDETPIDAKGFVNFVSRSTDPDVYLDPDSARIRARQLGCIGIRSYTARDGKKVWLPCTNTSDYNNRMNIRPDGRLKKTPNMRSEKSLAKTPAPKKDRIIGSTANRVGSAGSISSAGKIDLNDAVVQSLTTKVREHNKQAKQAKKNAWSMTNLGTLKAVYRRGAGAFSVSHRPGMTRNQWAMGRVNAFLSLLLTGKAKSSYITDNDLLPKGHPWKRKGLGSKSFYVDDIEYIGEYSYSGFSQRKQGMHRVNRYIAFSLDSEISELN